MRDLIFKIVSQITIDYHDSPLDPSPGPDAVAHYFRDRAYRRFCD